ncbi:hypothetical protein ACVSUJ_09275 [Yersinia enterocolitica]|uniref:hypothetical protein n=1 Tax=Yersinia enterocolitica TaxID=630 RepID=UPI0021AD8914|nr:hypothetical protein [Yersinia enterocolitica]
MVNMVFVGFALFFSPCGHDVCEWVTVTEDIYIDRHECESILNKLKERRPNVIFECSKVYREIEKNN